MIPEALDGAYLDFTGADLTLLVLGSANLFGGCLRGVRLVGADLNRALLNAADLSDADLSGAWLLKADGTQCLAERARFADADLTKVMFPRAELREADLRGACLDRAFLARADLRGADLRACSFGEEGGVTSLDEARLWSARLDGAHGRVCGPVDVGEREPRLLDGPEAAAWFRRHGAPEVEIA
ncbi:pentapeptide repeat-containing protein [Actinomadura sp. 9N407]|uniref:pentapeptide repeat-containing protein n=1 Tax=Actinomadura sp. 9N407 TaxID=3375154 RepID=UPI0037B3E689